MTIVWFLGYDQYHCINIPNPETCNVSITINKEQNRKDISMCFIVNRFTEQNSTILQTEIKTNGNKDRETQTVTETVRDRQRQIQAEIDRYRNRQK